MTELEERWAREEAEETAKKAKEDTTQKAKEAPAAFIPPDEEAIEAQLEDLPWPEEDEQDNSILDAMKEHWVGNPLMSGSGNFVPMGIVEVNHKQYIGGVAELNGLSMLDLDDSKSSANFNGGSVIMVFPMLLMEQRYAIGEPDPTDPNDPGKWGLRVGIKYIYETLRDIEEMHFQYDSLYMLRAHREEDLAVSKHYSDMCIMFKSQNSNIAQPNADEIAMVNRVKS